LKIDPFSPSFFRSVFRIKGTSDQMKDLRFAKLVIVINALVPGALLLWDAMHHRLGADPENFAIHTTGMLTLIFLALTLLVTPLRRFTGLSWLYIFRRSLGLYAFWYACAHLFIFYEFREGANLKLTVSEILHRPYLTIGTIALLLMVPLAATSTNWALRWMGPTSWKWLHRLVYLTVILGVIHYYIEVKSDVRLPIAFAIVFGILLLYRVIMAIVDPLRSRAAIRAGTKRWTGDMRVAAITQETPDVKTFSLIPHRGKIPFPYHAGQYLTLTVRVDGKLVRRSYTIASTPTRPKDLQVTIKRNDAGTSSRFLHDHVQIGDTITISAPSGEFTFDNTHETGIVLLAAGVGITPLMAILRSLIDQNWPGQIHLIYANKTERDIIFRNELDTLAAAHPNVHLTHTLTRPDANWPYRTGRIDAALLEQTVPDIATLPTYICGPEPMLHDTRTLLRALNVPEAKIRTESFGTAQHMPMSGLTSSAQTFTVTFASSAQSAPIMAGMPILNLAEDLGLPAQSECRSGICGTCKCKLLSGNVTMQTQDALTAADRANHIILLCQARATENVIVDL
jgi:ferredoxin-NADP reductase/DMSO/TMAO reductase YedYZ heme-binding membrane subunit